jgi:hypothetical protein
MIGVALNAGVPAAWVTRDEFYGAVPALRADLERRVGCVLAVARSRRGTTSIGGRRAVDLPPNPERTEPIIGTRQDLLIVVTDRFRYHRLVVVP